jgi:hypothetical protein
LNNKPPYLRHCKEFAFAECVGEGAIVAEFEDDVGTLSKGKSTVEFDDVWMTEFGVELELGYKLLIA